MAEAPSNRGTVKEKGKQEKGKPETSILNTTDRTIFLIPILCSRGDDPRLGGTLEEKLLRAIPKRHEEVVDSRDYNKNPENSNSQIRILFRAGNTDNREEFLKDYQGKAITVKQWEKLLLHGDLYCHDLDLKFDERKDIVDNNAVQVILKEKTKSKKKGKEEERKGTPEADKKEEMQKMIEDLEALQRQFMVNSEVLLRKMKSCMEAF